MVLVSRGWKKIPEEILRLYKRQGLGVFLYSILRWRLCPFEEIEVLTPKEGNIVDVGCGYGILANLLAHRSKKRYVVGYDRSAKRIRIAEKTQLKDGNVSFVNKKADFSEIQNIDCVVMSDFLHHVSYEIQARILKEIHSSLNDGGKVIILDIDNKPFWKFMVVALIDRILNPFDQIYYRERGNFTNLLKETGFEVTVFPAHRHLPLSDVIYSCQKNK